MASARRKVSDYASDDGVRRAFIYQTLKGYEVDFMRSGAVVQTRDMSEHNLRYSEDACENWVSGVMRDASEGNPVFTPGSF